MTSREHAHFGSVKWCILYLSDIFASSAELEQQGPNDTSFSCARRTDDFFFILVAVGTHYSVEFGYIDNLRNGEVVTENLTKRRAELLRKARTIDGITSTWTIDGRIVCLLENGRKVTVQTDSDLTNVRQQCRC